MKISDVFSLLQDLQESGRVRGGSIPFDREVTSICFDSRRVEAGCVFVAIRGEKNDGHNFLAEAEAKGAALLVLEAGREPPVHLKTPALAVANTRVALNRLASRLSGDPGRRLFCVGVTGTNGKTTTAYMTEAIFNSAGKPTGVIGTINHHFGERVWTTDMTTPDPISFQKRLAEFVELGAKALALEVSSHALKQNRVDEVPFDVAIFTNLTRDHLDYHMDMNDYFTAKQRLFSELLARSNKFARFAVINADDEYGRRIARPVGVTTWLYGLAADADLHVEIKQQGFDGTRFDLRTPFGGREFFIRMAGLHNVYNAVAAIGAGLAAGVSLEQCALALQGLIGVKGRLEAVPNRRGFHVFVDYAHTDDALKTVLCYLNGIRRVSGLRNRIITVFGCGGDRDAGKRPLMMRAAIANSDLVVLTSDNPRTEDPRAIMREALAGADPSLIDRRVFTEVDRRLGIGKAIALARPGDVVLIAGKGHEDYQQIGMTKHPFSDVDVVREILR